MKFFPLLICLLAVSAISIHGQNQSNSLNNEDFCYPFSSSQYRLIYSLGGNWERSYDNSNWETVYLPSSDRTSDKVIYRRTIKIDSKLIDRYNWQLLFMGLDDQVEVYLNEQFIGRYFGGMSQFELKIPRRMIVKDENILKLIVSTLSHTSKQARVQNLYPKRLYTGVIRKIILAGTPHIWVKDTRLKAYPVSGLSNFNVKAYVNVSSGESDKPFSGSLPDSLNIPGSPKNSITVEAFVKSVSTNQIIAQAAPKNILIERERTETVSFDIPVYNPELWSPEKPSQYKLVVKLMKNGQAFDEYCSTLGFRDIRVKDINGAPVLLLNGAPFEIKGVAYIEDHYSTLQTLSQKQMDSDVEALKTLGANTIRFKYSPPHPYMASLCDKYGLFMMIDMPVYEVPSSLLALDEIKVRMNNVTKRYITAYDNHPSLFAWGLSDGIEEGKAESDQFSDLMTNSLRSNSSNLIYKIILFGAESIKSNNIDFIGLRQEKDKAAFSKFRTEIARIRGLAPGKPIFLNFGFPISTDNHNGYSDPLSIEAQAYNIINNYYVSVDLKCSGNVINTFNDYLLENPLLIVENYNIYLMSSGIVSRTREQRLSFTALQALFNNENKPILNAGSYTDRTPVSFIVTGLVLALILVLLINRFRRFREYLFRSVLRPYNFYADIRDQRIMSSVQTLLLGIVISITVGIFVASLMYFYRMNLNAQYFYSILLPGNLLQEWLFNLIWMPELLMLVLACLVFCIALLVALAIRIFGFFIRARIFFSDTFTIVIWSGIPLLILLPVSIILIRLLMFSPSISILIFLLLILSYLWVWIRILKATSVVFDVPSIRVYIIGTSVQLVILALILTLYQYQYAIFSYGQYFVDVILKI